MGCASSGPVANSGKNFIDAAKETANDVAAKGEKTIQEVTETAKEGISTGIETVKEAVGTAVNTAENSIGNVVSKIGETFSSTTNAAKQTVENTKEAAEAAYDNTSSVVGEKVAEGVEGAERAVLTRMKSVEEAVSETQTTMSSKIDEMKEAVSAKTFGQLQNEVNDSFNKTKDSLKESLHIEDLDQDFDVLNEKVKDFEAKTEDLIDSLPSVLKRRLPTPAPSSPPPPPVEEKKEEPPPTFWEAAADAILLKRLRPFKNPLESDLETEVGSEKDEADTDYDTFEKQKQHNKLVEHERFVNVPRLMENGNDIVSVKSSDGVIADDDDD